jgi:hypothetical protein
MTFFDAVNIYLNMEKMYFMTVVCIGFAVIYLSFYGGEDDILCGFCPV